MVTPCQFADNAVRKMDFFEIQENEGDNPSPQAPQATGHTALALQHSSVIPTSLSPRETGPSPWFDNLTAIEAQGLFRGDCSDPRLWWATFNSITEPMLDLISETSQGRASSQSKLGPFPWLDTLTTATEASDLRGDMSPPQWNEKYDSIPEHQRAQLISELSDAWASELPLPRREAGDSSSQAGPAPDTSAAVDLGTPYERDSPVLDPRQASGTLQTLPANLEGSRTPASAAAGVTSPAVVSFRHRGEKRARDEDDSVWPTSSTPDSPSERALASHGAAAGAPRTRSPLYPPYDPELLSRVTSDKRTNAALFLQQCVELPPREAYQLFLCIKVNDAITIQGLRVFNTERACVLGKWAFGVINSKIVDHKTVVVPGQPHITFAFKQEAQKYVLTHVYQLPASLKLPKVVQVDTIRINHALAILTAEWARFPDTFRVPPSI
jgi:hypothetical protein